MVDSTIAMSRRCRSPGLKRPASKLDATHHGDRYMSATRTLSQDLLDRAEDLQPGHVVGPANREDTRHLAVLRW
jgi:hypothetical protein